VSHSVQIGTMICIISSESNNLGCSQFETSPVLLLIQLQPVDLGLLLRWGSKNWWLDI